MKHLNEDNIDIDQCKIKPEGLSAMLSLIDKGTISGKIAKTVFEEMYKTGKEPADIVKEKGLEQVSDTGEIEAILDKVLSANPSQVEEFKAGKEKLMGFFVGQVMKESRGKANPAMVNDLIRKKLLS